jgi:hypothetical protein
LEAVSHAFVKGMSPLIPSLLDQIVKERIIPKALELMLAFKPRDDIDAIIH